MIPNIPKTILICGREHKVIVDKNSGGGWFDEAKCQIGVGTKYPNEVAEIILHEVIEAVLSVRNMRYTKQRADIDNGDYLFCYNHEDFQNSILDIAQALKGIKF